MKKTLLAIALLAFAAAAPAQKNEARDTDRNLLQAALKGWTVRLGAGFQLGGTSPLPLPAEIRAIESFRPTLLYYIGADADKTFGSSPWGLRLGLRLETKGMETDASVKNYGMRITEESKDPSGNAVFSDVKGVWTGRVKTEVHNTYITIPLLATWQAAPRWKVFAGPYFSVMTSGRFAGTIFEGTFRDGDPTGDRTAFSDGNTAPYDFSSDLRRFQWGVEVGADFRAYKHLYANIALHWGLNDIFRRDFDVVRFSMYPIYGSLGFVYAF